VKRLAAALGLLLTACAAGGSAAASPSPGASASAAASPSPAALSCRLPIVRGVGSGGFLNLPAATFSVDPASQTGYDWPLGKWLPAFYNEISPDGSRYAFGEIPSVPSPPSTPIPGRIHVVDAASGSERIAVVPSTSTVVTIQPEGIYVNRVTPASDDAPQRLGLVDPTTLAYRQVTTDDRFWSVVGPGVAYAVDLDASDPDKPFVAFRRGGNRVVRLDLGTGAISTWYYAPGNFIWILGLDAGGLPIVGQATKTSYSVVLTAIRTVIYWGSAGVPPGSTAPVRLPEPDAPFKVAISDSHGVWIASRSGAIWLYRSGALTMIARLGFTEPGLAGACG